MKERGLFTIRYLHNSIIIYSTIQMAAERTVSWMAPSVWVWEAPGLVMLEVQITQNIYLLFHRFPFSCVSYFILMF